MAAVATPQTNGTAHPDIEKTAAAMEDLKVSEAGQKEQVTLPMSAADGLVKAPFSAPLDTCKPTVRPLLTAEETTKYKALRTKVEAWKQIPETIAKGAPLSALTDSERMFLTRECLQRYLRASSWNLATAEKRLENTLVWRREYGLEKHTADYISVENETGKQLIMGWDINARPCHYMRPSKQNTERSDRQIQHVVFMLERAVDLMPPGQETLSLLINFAETKSGQSTSIGQGRQTLSILQNHYPERLGRALVTNVPWFMSAFFKIITPFIDPLTREKIRFNEEMSLHVPAAQLLKASGGDVEFEYDHSIYWPALNKLCETKRAEYQTRWEKAGKRIGEHEMYLRGGEEQSRSATEAEKVKETVKAANAAESEDEVEEFKDAEEAPASTPSATAAVQA